MLLNNPMVDYLTLTTFDRDSADGLWLLWDRLTVDEQRESTRRMQYKGKVQDGIFWGSGVQDGREHFMLQASGERADLVALELAGNDEANCTRIDLQLTIHKPRGYSTRKVFDDLNEPGAAWSGRPKALNMVQSGDGCDTLYIGSRTSDLLMRLYIKPDEKGLPAFLRFECEYKRQKSGPVWNSIAADREAISRFLFYELSRLPMLPFGVSGKMLHILRATPQAPAVNRAESDSDTIRWLERQVEPAVLRLLHSHEHGDRMRRIIQRWSSHIDH